MKFKCKWIYRRADHGNADSDSVWKTVDLQPQEISEGDGNRYKWGGSWQTEWQCPRGSDASKNSTLKELSKTSHDIENTKDEMSEADPNFKSSMTAHEGTEKMLPPYSVTQLEGKHFSYASWGFFGKPMIYPNSQCFWYLD